MPSASDPGAWTPTSWRRRACPFLKDGLTSEYEGQLAWWHGVQGAALAALALDVVSFFGGALPDLPFGGLAAMSLVALAVATMRIASHRRRFRQDLDALAGAIDRLKPRRTPG